mmetsp:Transcript_21541/g.63260  ORF Transcript_21541/g.63260 Transcript_21541/m.63260 type:complete len:290 (+) Transcript_21541:74-943(+)
MRRPARASPGSRAGIFAASCIQQVAVLADGELLVVVNADVDPFRARVLGLWVVELRDVAVPEALRCGEALLRVVLHQPLEQVDRIVARLSIHAVSPYRPPRLLREAFELRLAAHIPPAAVRCTAARAERPPRRVWLGLARFVERQHRALAVDSPLLAREEHLVEHVGHMRRLQRAHVVAARRPEDLADLFDHIERRVAREDGLASEHLAEDASKAPQINRGAVGERAHQYLGRAVPACGDIIGHDGIVVDVEGVVGLLGVRPLSRRRQVVLGREQRASEPKVGDLHEAL